MTASSALVLFSAGQDSTVSLAWALDRFDRVETVGFDYGQRHAVELTQRPRVLAAIRERFPGWTDRLGDDHVVDLRGFGAIAESALTTGRAIEMQANGLPSTFVPGRNLAFLVAAAALAYRRDLAALVGGMCETDYSGYPDCRRATMDAVETALALGLDQPVPIHTPLMHLSKAQTWTLAETLGGAALVDLIIEETHTCYLGDRSRRWAWGYGCGTCPACDLRAKGYEGYTAGGAR